MKFLHSFIILFFLQLAGLAASLSIPMDPRRWQKAIKNYDITTTICHSVLTFCRTDADCCPGLACVAAEEDFLCTPKG